MSYGWLTESSLIPTPGKPIEDVSDASLQPLHNAIHKIQRETRSNQASTGAKYSRFQRRLRTYEEKKYAKKNIGVDARDEKDTRMSNPPDKVSKRLKTKLDEKVLLYDSLVDNPGSDSNQDRGDHSSCFPGSCLDLSRLPSERRKALGHLAPKSATNLDTPPVIKERLDKKSEVADSNAPPINSHNMTNTAATSRWDVPPACGTTESTATLEEPLNNIDSTYVCSARERLLRLRRIADDRIT